MQEAGLPVYYIQGNHDLNKIPWLSLHPWPTNLNKKVVTLVESGMTVLGQESTTETEITKVLGNLPSSVDALLMHQSEVVAMPFSFEFVLNDVPEQIKNILIGHIHKPQDYNHGATHLWYPGSPYVTDISNTESRSFLVESVVNGETVVTREPIPGRSFYNLRVSNEETLEEAKTLVESIAESDARNNGFAPVVHVTYPPEISEKAHQHFLSVREVLDVYTWMSVSDSTGSVEDIAQVESSVNIEEIINEHVDHPVPKEILLKIFDGNDTGEILRSGLEEIL